VRARTGLENLFFRISGNLLVAYGCVLVWIGSSPRIAKTKEAKAGGESRCSPSRGGDMSEQKGIVVFAANRTGARTYFTDALTKLNVSARAVLAQELFKFAGRDGAVGSLGSARVKPITNSDLFELRAKREGLGAFRLFFVNTPRGRVYLSAFTKGDSRIPYDAMIRDFSRFGLGKLSEDEFRKQVTPIYLEILPGNKVTYRPMSWNEISGNFTGDTNLVVDLTGLSAPRFRHHKGKHSSRSAHSELALGLS
jgi:hypothetical protein